MLSGDSSYEFMSGIEDGVVPRVYGEDVARVEEPTAGPKDPFTKEEVELILADPEDLG